MLSESAANPEPRRTTFISLSRAISGDWFFALLVGDNVSFGPLLARWDGLPQLRDVGDRMAARVLVVAESDGTDQDDLRFALRQVSSFATARIHIYQIRHADLATTFGLLAPGDGVLSTDALHRALVERLTGVALEGLEDGVALALSMLLAGMEAHRRRVARFRSLPITPGAVMPMTGRLPPQAAPGHEAMTASPPVSSYRPRRPAPERSLLTLAEVGEALGIDRTTAYRLVSAKHLASHRVGRQIRVRRADLEAYLAARRTRSVDEEAVRARGKITTLRLPKVLEDEEARLLRRAKETGLISE